MVSLVRGTAGILFPLFAGSGLAGCGSSGGGGSVQPEPVGSVALKPDGSGVYVVDPHRAGGRSRLHLAEVAWGRLVAVHALDANGDATGDPVFREFLVDERILTDSVDYVLEESKITQETRLVIQREFELGSTSFAALLRNAEHGLVRLTPRSAEPTVPGPFTFVARNACLMLRFDDLLDDDEAARDALADDVRLLTGYPPDRPAEPRIFFDPNHGGVASGTFHSTRILVDFTVSEIEAASAPSLPLQSIGLPPSEFANTRPNAALRLPTRRNHGTGQFTLLSSVSGVPLDRDGNGPVDEDGPTLEVVRAFRGGNAGDVNNGFLLDLGPPHVVGSWPIVIDEARPLGSMRFEIDLRFSTACRAAPAKGDVLAASEFLLEVEEQATAPGNDGSVTGARVRLLGNRREIDPNAFLGAALLRSLYEPGRPVEDGCWVSFQPRPRILPATDVPSQAQTILRFNEPMDPASLEPFDTFMHVRGGQSTPISSTSLVVGSIGASPDLEEFSFTPRLPLAHDGSRNLYHVLVPAARGVTDLAGNELPAELPPIEFSIDPASPHTENGAIVLRFDSPDEIDAFGAFDLRGQFLYDLERGVVKARPVSSISGPVSRTMPVPSIMTPFLAGVQSPLTPLGSKVQFVWRYADMGWTIYDENKYNLDVVGLNWTPARGHIVRDFFPEFEIRLAHSRRLPDEQPGRFALPKYPSSGLASYPIPFSDNILDDPASPQVVVHPRPLGYRLDPLDVFLGIGGNLLVPFPVNTTGNAPYLWRDTAIVAKGGFEGAGVPMDIEVGAPLNLENEIGAFAPPAGVPSVGLPLLIEIRCYPTSTGIGFNPLDISLASNTSQEPNFRAFSSGGIGTSGLPITKDPDAEVVPTGGFNPRSRPPGRPTRYTADNTLYIGQLDAVTRVSRAHSIWLDTKTDAPLFAPFVAEPAVADLPPRTQLLFHFRGADEFHADADLAPFAAEALDPYGDLPLGTVLFHRDDATWKSSLQEIDGARYFQFRVTFVGDLVSGLTPELSAVGIAFDSPPTR